VIDSKKDYIVRTYREGDEKEIAKAYNFGNIPLDLKEWIWKQKQSPDFDPSLVIVAEKDGKVIGIAQAQVRNLAISQMLTVKASQGADLLVVPEYRMKGVATDITSVLRKNLRAKGVVIGPYGISLPTTFRNFYLKRGGIKIPDKLHCRTVFVKSLSCENLKRQASLVNHVLKERPDLSHRLAKIDLTILFRIRGHPSFAVKVCRGEISIAEEKETAVRPDVLVVAPKLSSLTKISELVKLILSGNIRVSGLIRNFFKISKVFTVIRDVRIVLRNS